MIQKIVILAAVALVAGCSGVPKETGGDDQAALVLKKSSFSDLRGWQQDDMRGFMQAYDKSCARILKKGADEAFSSDPAFGTYGDWQTPCRAAKSVDTNNPAAIRAFVEKHFNVMQATAAGNPEGLFTGYYVSTLRGSRSKHGPYQHPLLGRPDDLVMVELGDFRKELKGQRIAGRVIDGKLKPYENRAQIVSGKMPSGQVRPLVWLDNPHDAFFVQVQGSGNVHLDDGSIMRVGYDGQNGHPYYAIGRELVKRGIYSKDEVSMEAIRTWLENNPAEAQELMNTNPSYVFFREMPDDGSGESAVGGEGVKLTAGRSIAIDRGKLPYGFPLWLDAAYNDSAATPIRRLMMAQDTGGAIRGAVRGDYFWGSGAEAEKMAGPMKAKGGYFFLLPKTIQ
jgi:membrane-bound lytic murein transglycosylase A